jgi:D-alanyl-D-alanine carboxypeptidase/D-alanyl-D-alanine-endopeptidase (penicillin-binding protein 4)
LKNKVSHIFLILSLFIVGIAKGQEQSAIAKFMDNPEMRHAQVGFVFRELSTGSIIEEYSSQKSCTPASVTKLITTATGLEVLGPEFRFSTVIEYDGHIDEKGCLQGNLYIRGGGDPSLGSSAFKDSMFIQKWIAALQKIGILSVNGQIIADVSLYEKDPIPSLWIREDLGNYYGAGAFALSVFDNTVSITLKSSKKEGIPQVVNTFPNVGYVYENNLKIRNTKKDSIYVFGDPYSLNRSLYGTIRENQEKVTVKGDISNPPLFLAKYFQTKMKDAGIGVKGGVAVLFTKGEKKRKIIYTHYSPTLAEIIKETNVHSNNNYAEHLLKYLSLQKDSVASTEGGTKFVRSYWAAKGLDVSGLFMYDGSGLSPKDAICADFLCNILVYMNQKSSNAGTYYASLPIAGETGTVAPFLKNTSLKGQVHLKSGSFKNVQCYAGYVGKQDKQYAFCIMLNNFVGERKKTVGLVENLLTNIVDSIK